MKWCVESHVLRDWWWRDRRRFWVAYRDDEDAYATEFDSWHEAYDYALAEARSEKFQEVLEKIMCRIQGHASACPPEVHSIFDPCFDPRPGNCTEDS